MLRYEERRIISLSSGSFLSAVLHRPLSISMVGITIASFLKLGSADVLWGLRECSFWGELDKARKNIQFYF